MASTRAAAAVSYRFCPAAHRNCFLVTTTGTDVRDLSFSCYRVIQPLTAPPPVVGVAGDQTKEARGGGQNQQQQQQYQISSSRYKYVLCISRDKTFCLRPKSQRASDCPLFIVWSRCIIMPYCRSCPPGPWLPASSTSASGSRECHQLVSAQGAAAGQSSEQPGQPGMTSSFSVTQRLNNQLSVDSSGSGGHPLAHHHHRGPHPVLEAASMSRHPPLYSEATTAASGQQQPHFPLHNNHS